METRKIQTVGGGTYTVSVPKEWARKQNLETGEAVRLYTHRDGSLIVRGEQSEATPLASVTLSVDDHSIGAVEQLVHGAYVTGFERITIVAQDPLPPEHRQAVRTVSRQLVGTNVLETEPTALVVRAMLDSSAVSVRQSIDQAVSIVTSMLQTTVDGLSEGTPITEHVQHRRPEVTRLAALIRRHHNRSLRSFEQLDALGIDRVPLARYTRMAGRLEDVATTIVRLAEIVEEVSLSDEHSQIVADQIDTIGSSLQAASECILDQTKRIDPASQRLPSADRHLDHGGPDDGASDPARARVRDALGRLRADVRSVERLGDQPAIAHQ
ncbi:phosphate uptake regulator PhoU [Halorhabdus sp. CBA1104]|uniref:AbrB/MazE/SpoVT family DNA-binding domain-containing protein n=1 Tax=Halorhabdus sp. CBA1104 TaxID=1380432 RepID=UPI0012B2733D|nr:AbrB/MazE/SpoVT family DNA-binding domain-containing protein [Halorhabdus sp. CBA1104]QGN06379.1 phosphate uptake regulator PhoU [Halorhabdus sp. CBA1104]